MKRATRTYLGTLGIARLSLSVQNAYTHTPAHRLTVTVKSAILKQITLSPVHPVDTFWGGVEMLNATITTNTARSGSRCGEWTKRWSVYWSCKHRDIEGCCVGWLVGSHNIVRRCNKRVNMQPPTQNRDRLMCTCKKHQEAGTGRRLEGF